MIYRHLRNDVGHHLFERYLTWISFRRIEVLYCVSCEFYARVFFCDKCAFIFQWISIMFLWNYETEFATQILDNIFQISLHIWAVFLLFYLLRPVYHNQLIYNLSLINVHTLFMELKGQNSFHYSILEWRMVGRGGAQRIIIFKYLWKWLVKVKVDNYTKDLLSYA